MNLTGLTALVTGGASGMGKVTALSLARQGARVAIVDLNEEQLRATCHEVSGIEAYPCDVSNREQVNQTINRVTSELGPIGRLVHCAAIMPAYLMRNETPENLERVMRVNYFGTVNFVHGLLPKMLDRNSGDIIVYSSMIGTVPTNRMGAYCASKAAVSMYMEILSGELEDTDLRFLLVCPPPVQTPLIMSAIETEGSQRLKSDFEGGKMARPEDIVAEVEAALERGTTQLWPGAAKAARLLHKIAPRLLWKFTMKTNN